MLLCPAGVPSPRIWCLNKHGSVSYPGFGTTKAETRAMPTDQHTPAPATTQEPFRYRRGETVAHLHDPRPSDRPRPSTRSAARSAGLPHTTLRYWQQRQQHTEAPPELVAFFESPVGL